MMWLLIELVEAKKLWSDPVFSAAQVAAKVGVTERPCIVGSESGARLALVANGLNEELR